MSYGRYLEDCFKRSLDAVLVSCVLTGYDNDDEDENDSGAFLNSESFIINATESQQSVFLKVFLSLVVANWLVQNLETNSQ